MTGPIHGGSTDPHDLGPSHGTDLPGIGATRRLRTALPDRFAGSAPVPPSECPHRIDTFREGAGTPADEFEPGPIAPETPMWRRGEVRASAAGSMPVRFVNPERSFPSWSSPTLELGGERKRLRSTARPRPPLFAEAAPKRFPGRPRVVSRSFQGRTSRSSRSKDLCGPVAAAAQPDRSDSQ